MPKSSSDDLKTLGSLFRLLSDKTRLQIVMLLASGERNVTAICEDLKLPQPTVSHHLGLLRMSDLIVNKRKGKKVIYALGNAGKVSGGKLKFNLDSYNITIEGL